MLTEADGGPVAVVVKGANIHDSLLLQDALEAVIVEPPDPRQQEQNLCLDKAFSGAPSDATARVFGYEPHCRQIGEEKKDAQGCKRHKARRWVVERTMQLAEPLPRDHHPLREEGGELPGRRATRLCFALVPQATPAHDLRWFLRLSRFDSAIWLNAGVGLASPYPLNNAE